jgi:hypothetical protein
MYKLEKLIIGTFASFVEDGTEVGENTVGIDFYPEAPNEAWASIGCVLDATPETETETDTDYCPNPGGGYSKEDDQNVVKDLLKMSLRAHSEIIHRLVWGLDAPIQDDTPVTPFTRTDRFVRGWLHFTGRAQDGTDRFVAALYGKLRLDANPKWSKDPTKPAISFEVIKSSLINSVVPDNVNPIIPD